MEKTMAWMGPCNPRKDYRENGDACNRCKDWPKCKEIKEGRVVRAEDVTGTVIGPISVTGHIYYQGREQGEMLIADTEFLLKRKANAAVTSLRAKYPDCYTEEDWELKVG